MISGHPYKEDVSLESTGSEGKLQELRYNLPANILSFEATGTSIVSFFQSTSTCCECSLSMIKGIREINF